MSETRKIYFARLTGRVLIFLLSILCFFAKPEIFAPIEGMRFFAGPSLLHLLWLIWVTDMLAQLFPIKRRLSIGSLKVFRQHFRPIREKINRKALTSHIVSAGKGAFRVLVLWILLIAAIGALHVLGVLTHVHLFLITIAFYVCDLICVLIWCPFRLLMKNRCCTTCRIFNWDHLMMFSPLIFVRSFYCWSLLFLSIAVFLVWELCILIYPERFFEQTNAALQCMNCTDKLCTQYCQKLRK